MRSALTPSSLRQASTDRPQTEHVRHAEVHAVLSGLGGDQDGQHAVPAALEEGRLEARDGGRCVAGLHGGTIRHACFSRKGRLLPSCNNTQVGAQMSQNDAMIYESII